VQPGAATIWDKSILAWEKKKGSSAFINARPQVVQITVALYTVLIYFDALLLECL
jgi:hypothetical protein